MTTTISTAPAAPWVAIEDISFSDLTPLERTRTVAETAARGAAVLLAASLIAGAAATIAALAFASMFVGALS